MDYGFIFQDPILSENIKISNYVPGQAFPTEQNLGYNVIYNVEIDADHYKSVTFVKFMKIQEALANLGGIISVIKVFFTLLLSRIYSFSLSFLLFRDVYLHGNQKITLDKNRYLQANKIKILKSNININNYKNVKHNNKNNRDSFFPQNFDQNKEIKNDIKIENSNNNIIYEFIVKEDEKKISCLKDYILYPKEKNNENQFLKLNQERQFDNSKIKLTEKIKFNNEFINDRLFDNPFANRNNNDSIINKNEIIKYDLKKKQNLTPLENIRVFDKIENVYIKNDRIQLKKKTNN